MRQSQLFTKTTREAPKDETSINAKLLARAGFISKEMAGVYTILPLGFRVLKNIEGIIRKEMVALGAQEILMPSLQSKANWEKTGRWETYDTLFRFESFYSKIKYALGPTHEEIVTPLVKKFVSSYKELPRYVFQIQNKFRDEKRAKSGLLRGREFLMKDLYSFHLDDTDLDRFYEAAKKSYERIFKQVGLGEKTYFTFASGGTFSQYSHEFQTICETGEDTIYICEKCRVAVNEEIIKEQNICPQCGSKDLKVGKAIEVGNTFKLKTKFSRAFDLSVKDEGGKPREVLMGCYGIGLTRLMGTVAEALADEKGIVWPESIAPFSVHLLALPGGEKEANALYEKLEKKGVEVLYDDRTDKSAGEKFADADLIGIPYRVVVSKKTLEQKSAEVKERKNGHVELINVEEMANFLFRLL